MVMNVESYAAEGVKESTSSVIPSEARNLALFLGFPFAEPRARFLASLGMTLGWSFAA
jgi:hypothetical protein